jgi:hypothetical protein
MIRRLLLIPVLAFAFGFTVATLRGQGGGLLDGDWWRSAPGVYLAGFGVGAAVLAAARLLPRRPPRHAA